MNKLTLHILHVYFSQEWQLSSIIYSLLFLFCILFIVSTQIAASRRKNLKSDVWTLWLDSNLVTRKKENSILAFYLQMLSVLLVLSCSKKEIIFICVCFCLNTCIMRVVLSVYEFGQMSRLDLSCRISSKFQPTTKRI